MTGLATETILAFALASFLIELTPGPNMTYLAVVSLAEGRRNGMATVAGVALGLAVIGLAAALGVTTLIQNSATAYEALRWAGVLFLLYLAWEGWSEAGDGVTENPSAHLGRNFNRGLIANLLNPKAAVFYVAVLPTFLPPEPTQAQGLTLTAIYVAVATAVHAGVVLFAGSLRPMFEAPERLTLARRVLALALAAVAIWFAVSTAR